MGKTNLVPLLTYFTEAEYRERKAAAKQAGLSVSNFNREALGYSLFKQGKPKKKAPQNELPENSIGFEKVGDSNKILIDPGSSMKNLKDYLPTEADVEDAFSNLELPNPLGKTRSESDDKISAVDINVETSVEKSENVIKLQEVVAEEITGEVEEINGGEINGGDFLFQNDNILQPGLFS